MPTIVGIWTLMSTINTSEHLKARTVFFKHFGFYEHLKSHAQLSWARQFCITSAPGWKYLLRNWRFKNLRIFHAFARNYYTKKNHFYRSVSSKIKKLCNNSDQTCFSDTLTSNMPLKIVSEYDQEIPQSQTADNPVAPRGRAAQPSRDTRKTN